MDKLKRFFYVYELEVWLGALFLVFIITIVVLFIHDHNHWKKYKCISGHNEDVWIPAMTVNGITTGGYWSSGFVCDYEVLRDSIK